MGQSTSVATQLIDQERVLDFDCYDGYVETSDAVLGLQKYISLKPGCKGKIEASENFESGIVIMISVQADNSSTPSLLRLSHDSQSLGNVDTDDIYLLMVIDDVPAVPSLTRLNELYAQYGNHSIRNAIQQPIVINGFRDGNLVNAVRNANNVQVGGRRVGCPCNKK